MTSDLKKRVDEIIRRLFEAGILQKWNNKCQRKPPIEWKNEPPLQMKMEHVNLLSFTLGFGLLSSTIAFILELIIHNRITRKTKSKIWIQLEKCVDGKRHYFLNWSESLQMQKFNSVHLINRRIEL